MSEGSESVLAELQALGSETNRSGMARFGINTERAFGVSMSALRPLARRHRRDHALAAALWATGWHEARLLAVLVDDPSSVTPEQMDRWTADFDSWDLCDQACMKLYARTSHVDTKVRAWARDEREFVRQAAFALIAGYAVHGKTVPDTVFAAYLPLIEEYATDPRNYVRKAVNWALRQVGKRSPALREQALGTALRLATSDDRTARWIGRDAAKELSDPVHVARVSRKAGSAGP